MSLAYRITVIRESWQQEYSNTVRSLNRTRSFLINNDFNRCRQELLTGRESSRRMSDYSDIYPVPTDRDIRFKTKMSLSCALLSQEAEGLLLKTVIIII